MIININNLMKDIYRTSVISPHPTNAALKYHFLFINLFEKYLFMQLPCVTVVVVYINTMKSTFDFNI